jgi:hypothetical protein
LFIILHTHAFTCVFHSLSSETNILHYQVSHKEGIVFRAIYIDESQLNDRIQGFITKGDTSPILRWIQQLSKVVFQGVDVARLDNGYSLCYLIYDNRMNTLMPMTETSTTYVVPKSIANVPRISIPIQLHQDDKEDKPVCDMHMSDDDDDGYDEVDVAEDTRALQASTTLASRLSSLKPSIDQHQLPSGRKKAQSCESHKRSYTQNYRGRHDYIVWYDRHWIQIGENIVSRYRTIKSLKCTCC